MRPATRVALTTLAAAGLLATGVQAISKVTRSGRYLYTDDGNRFFIKGVAYQEQGQLSNDPNNPFLEPENYIDPLADSNACARDIPYLQQLGVNAIRVYSVDSSRNHDACMNALSQAGIYTIIDLSLPVNGSIDRLAPAWTTNLLNLYIGTIDAFSKYDNVLAYNVGNEVVIEPNGTAAAAFIKAAARDTKAYLASKSSSALVGYAAVDADSSWLDPLANYLSCDPDGNNSGATALDIFGLNNYEWCGEGSPTVYNNKNADFSGYNIPAYFSEYGCITSPPRLWTEVGTLFSTPMSDIWSGGVAFSYFPAQSGQGQFGMVTVDGNTVTTSEDFDRLKAQYGNLTLPTTPSQSSAGSTSYPSCPAQSDTFLASTKLPPTPNAATCACLHSTFACQFTPTTPNVSTIVGPLIDTTCQYLGQVNGNCNQIAGDGQTGTYGAVSFCDPSTKLSYIMDQYYELTNRNAQSCNFAGNATINSQAPSSSSAVSAAQSSCLANPSATFVPSAAATSGTSRPTSTSSSGSNSNGANAAAGLMNREAVMGTLVAAVFTVIGAAFTLA